MDVLLLNSAVYDIPSARRVGAIVFDGAADMQLWPGPSADRDLAEQWGEGLQEALDTQLRQIGVKELGLSDCARVHRGKLHCDFLCWVCSKPSEPGESRSPAPNAETLTRAVTAALEFVAAKAVVRVAFGAIGAGPGELEAAERLAIIVRAARAYEDKCYAEGRPQGIEEVLVCERSSAILANARRRVEALAKGVAAPRPAPASDAPPAKAKSSSSRKSGAASAVRKPTRASTRLDPDEVAMRRPSAIPYDRTRRFTAGEWLAHPKFGVGRVNEITPEGAMVVLFEDNEQRKMLQNRS